MKRTHMLQALVVLAAVLVMSPCLLADFVLDDRIAILDSQCVRGPFRPALVFGSNFWCELGVFRSIQSWRPWTVLAWWPLAQTRELMPWLFHALNLALHAGVTWMTLRTATMLGCSTMAATIAAGTFAVLAIHVDAVAPAVGAAGLWSTAFVVLAVRGQLDHARWTALAAVLACLAKEDGVLVVPWLFMFEWIRARRHRQPLALRGPIAAALAVASVLWVRALILGAATGSMIPPHVNPLVELPWWQRIPSGLALIGRYHRVLLTGAPLAADYDGYALPLGDEVDTVSLATGATAVTAWIALLWWRREPVIRGLTACVLVALAFVSNIPLVLPAVFAERLLYLPSWPMCLALGILGDAVRPRWRYASLVALVGVLALQAGRAFIHAARWRNEISLLQHTSEVVPRNARVRMGLAWHALRSGDTRSASEHALAANAVRPQWGEPLAILAVVDDLHGQPQLALRKFQTAMTLDPRDGQVVDAFIQFLLRYGHVEPARAVYRSHTQARGEPLPFVTRPP